jgi:hypothetical protein
MSWERQLLPKPKLPSSVAVALLLGRVDWGAGIGESKSMRDDGRPLRLDEGRKNNFSPQMDTDAR